MSMDITLPYCKGRRGMHAHDGGTKLQMPSTVLSHVDLNFPAQRLLCHGATGGRSCSCMPPTSAPGRACLAEQVLNLALTNVVWQVACSTGEASAPTPSSDSLPWRAAGPGSRSRQTAPGRPAFSAPASPWYAVQLPSQVPPGKAPPVLPVQAAALLALLRPPAPRRRRSRPAPSRFRSRHHTHRRRRGSRGRLPSGSSWAGPNPAKEYKDSMGTERSLETGGQGMGR